MIGLRICQRVITKHRLGNRQLLILMVGQSGSGKSYFCRRLITKLDNLVCVNPELVSKDLYGCLSVPKDKIELLKQAINKRIVEDLKSGQSVIYDHLGINRHVRDQKRSLVPKNLTVLKLSIQIQTPPAIAGDRHMYRQDDDWTQRAHGSTQAARLQYVKTHIQYLKKHSQPLEAYENPIAISGLIPFRQQYRQFLNDCWRLV